MLRGTTAGNVITTAADTNFAVNQTSLTANEEQQGMVTAEDDNVKASKQSGKIQTVSNARQQQHKSTAAAENVTVNQTDHKEDQQHIVTVEKQLDVESGNHLGELLQEMVTFEENNVETGNQTGEEHTTSESRQLQKLTAAENNIAVNQTDRTVEEEQQQLATTGMGEDNVTMAMEMGNLAALHTDKQTALDVVQQQVSTDEENVAVHRQMDVTMTDDQQHLYATSDENIDVNQTDLTVAEEKQRMVTAEKDNVEVGPQPKEHKAIENLKRLKLCLVKLRSEDILSAQKGSRASKQSSSLEQNNSTKASRVYASLKGKQKSDNFWTEKTKKCQYCGKSYRKQTLKIHIWRVHSTFEPFECHKCRKRFKFKELLTKHQREKCLTKKERVQLRVPAVSRYYYLKCFRCLTDFNQKKEQRKHEKKCKERFTCEFCNIKFRNESNRSSHEKVHRKDPKPFHCNFCSQKFSADWKRAAHTKIHSGPVKCNTCGKVCCSQTAYNDHIKKYHVNDSKVLCCYCGKLYLRNHILRHEQRHQVREKKLICQTCNKEFSRKDHLARHVQSMHTLERNVCCKLCSHKTTSKSKLQEHVRSVHEKSFKCTSCEKIFGTKGGLKRHTERRHSTIRAYTCLYCRLSFKTKASLNSHEDIIHLNKKKFECSFCDKRFHLKHHLQNHERTHTNERPYVCEVCGSAFRVLHHLFQHNATHQKHKNKKLPAKFRVLHHLFQHNATHQKQKTARKRYVDL